jgi:hypothetical protein
MSRTATESDISADPFQERGSRITRGRMRLLGCDFEFETDSPELRRIVDWAYADLPRHKLSTTVPRLKIRIARAPSDRGRGRKAARSAEIPRIEMLSGADFLGATTSASDFVVLSPAQRTGLIVVSPRLLRSEYHVRYELLEFAVFTLATRVQGLVGLHAACVGRGGRGLLLMGDSGAGKSTAALHCLLRGFEFLSEDSVFVAPDSLLATGVANFAHVRRDSLRFVPQEAQALVRRSPVIKRRSGVEKFEIDLRRREFRPARRPLEIAACVFMTAERAAGAGAGPGSLASSLRRGELLARLGAAQPYAAHQPGWMRFRQRLTGVPAFELRRGAHPEQTVGELEKILAVTGKH